MDEAKIKIVIDEGTGSLEHTYVMVNGEEVGELLGCRGAAMSSEPGKMGHWGITMDSTSVSIVEEGLQ